MSSVFVIDCSVAMTWLFPDEATAQTAELFERLANQQALVPSLWFLEVTNVLALAERKGRVTTEQRIEFITQLSRLSFEVDAEAAGRAFDHLLPLCRTHGLTSYDAVYLDLALRSKLPLATLDEPLRKAAEKLDVKLLAR